MSTENNPLEGLGMPISNGGLGRGPWASYPSGSRGSQFVPVDSEHLSYTINIGHERLLNEYQEYILLISNRIVWWQYATKLDEEIGSEVTANWRYIFRPLTEKEIDKWVMYHKQSPKGTEKYEGDIDYIMDLYERLRKVSDEILEDTMNRIRSYSVEST